MDRKLQALFGLKFNPFAPDIPIEGLFVYDELASFLWRMENIFINEGGFSLITGESGRGKSAALRLLETKLSAHRDLEVGVITHPSASVSDFYRELGDIFGVPLKLHNRWHSFKSLREKWSQHLNTTLVRPVLFIDEAQEMPLSVLNELRLLTSLKFDSQLLMSVVLSGDQRLPNKLKSENLLPLASRIKFRLNIDYASSKQLSDSLHHMLDTAGNSQLMTPELINVISEHSIGNYRVLYNNCSILLSAAIEKDVHQLDEKLYLECFPASTVKRGRK
jgi:type II secretory pathway predicted ATPase ExeA